MFKTINIFEVRKCFYIAVFLFANHLPAFSQLSEASHSFYFISDVQAPMTAEKIVLKAYRNEAARDSLFADLIRQQPKILFMLGDLTMKGSKKKAWVPMDAFICALKKTDAAFYAIPGNHEYMGCDSKAKRMFVNRFNEKSLSTYCVIEDSIAVLMLNSNFSKLSKEELSKQELWFNSMMDSLDTNPAVMAIIVCTHHAPYSNSKIVSSSEQLADLFVPRFDKSSKAKLFVSGHSHNLEYFADRQGKHFIVMGGGGGIAQPLKEDKKRIYADLLSQDLKPLYFYLIVEKSDGNLRLIARGFKKDFVFFELEIGEVVLY